jgi:flagellar FliJ protein
MFKFRLQSVLEYRQTLEDQAKGRYLAAKAACIRAEAEIAEIDERRKNLLLERLLDLTGHIEMQRRIEMLDDYQRQTFAALSVLRDETAAAEAEWIERKKEHEIMVRLRETAYQGWMYDENRREQAALDEWAVLRRSA